MPVNYTSEVDVPTTALSDFSQATVTRMAVEVMVTLMEVTVTAMGRSNPTANSASSVTTSQSVSKVCHA